MTSAIVSAVEAAATIDPVAFVEITRSARSAENGPVQRVLARGFAAAAAQIPNAALDFLCEDRRRFILRDYGSEDQCDSIALITAIASNADSDGRNKLEETILSWSQYREGAELSADMRTWDREARLRLLKAIPQHLLSADTTRFVGQEKRGRQGGIESGPVGGAGFVKEIPPLTKEEMADAPDEAVS